MDCTSWLLRLNSTYLRSLLRPLPPLPPLPS